MTRQLPLFPAINVAKADGYIILIDRNGPRIVADNILWCNEVRMDKQEKFLYAAETWGNHILRFPVQPDGSLGDREIYGPADLGFGAAVDGFTFDAEGNIWATTFVRNGLMIISPEGEAQTVFEDPNQAGLEHMVAKIQEGQLRGEDFGGCLGTQVQFPSSITFGGPDLKTVYVGSLAMPYLLTFQSPVAGLPMRHWR
jgi:sugar lactone lactonase YvrE